MEYLELIFKEVQLDNVESLLTNLGITKTGNLQDSHFFLDNQDATYSKNIDFSKYYSVPATGMLRSNYAEIGAKIYDVVTIISGCFPTVEIVLNFQNISLENREKIYYWMQSNSRYANQIILGIEPVETDDEIIYVINNCHK